MAPTITVTLEQLVNAAPAVQRLCTERLPVKTAYRVARLARAMDPELKAFDTQRGALLKAHGDPIPDAPDMYQIREGEREAFAALIRELSTEEIALPGPPLALEGLCDLTPGEILALGPLVEELEG